MASPPNWKPTAPPPRWPMPPPPFRSLEIQIATTEDQLNVLLGRHPGPIIRNSLTNQPQLAPEIPAGLPSELLRRRPDVLQSEQSLIAANANIGVSVANFFPQIGLTTLFGKASPELSAFTAGSANVWNLGRHDGRPDFSRRPIARPIPRGEGEI